jgi:predicted nucleotidyltransferase
MAKEEVIAKLKKYVFILEANGIVVSKAFLFGSYLQNAATEHSDIDVMIVSPQFDERDDALAGRSWSLTRKVDSRIEPYLVGLNRFLTDDFSPILEVVKQEGLEITLN